MNDTQNIILDRNLIFDAVRVTEAAAIAACRLQGRGDEKEADRVAVEAMRQALNALDIQGRIVIGEGERDEAPMLYIGEKVGSGSGQAIDIAVDPLEGTTILASGANDALTVIALANKGCFLNAPDVYMEKIATGFDFPEQIIDLDNSVKENLGNIALAKKVNISDLVVVILDRPRHKELMAKIRAATARIRLIQDGDIAAVLATSMPSTGADVYMGIGGAPEGVLAAAALSTSGGQICTRLMFNKEEEKTRAKTMGIKDFSRKYYLNDLASGDVIFAATGVTDGYLLKGVQLLPHRAITHSLVMHSGTKTIRKIESSYSSLL